MRRGLLLLCLFAACIGDGDGGDGAAVDGGGIDARPYGRGENCVPGPVYLSCTKSRATVTQVNVALSPMFQCSWPPESSSVTCVHGCATVGTWEWMRPNRSTPPPAPQTLCAAAPSLRRGGDCPCTPTRTVIAPDGTVGVMSSPQCCTTIAP